MNSIKDIKITKLPNIYKLPIAEELENEMNMYMSEEQEEEQEADYQSYIEDIKTRIDNDLYITCYEKEDYNNYIAGVVSDSAKFSSTSKGQAIQNRDNKRYYINYINNITKRSKNNIPIIDNIKAIPNTSIKNNIVNKDHKIGTVEIIQTDGYSDLHITDIKNDFDKGVYELLPYQSFNQFGCSYVKTCFNTIGKEYDYVCPFIDYDLKESNISIAKEITKAIELVDTFSKVVLYDMKTLLKISIIGYSSAINKDINKVIDNTYIKIQSKPKECQKLLSLHIVFYDVKIHCIELKERIKEHIKEFVKYPAFDLSPYTTGSLRHIGSIKSGLVDKDKAELKRVDNLTDEEILHQFITYHNSYIKYNYIHLNIDHIHNKPINNNKNYKSFDNIDIIINYGDEQIETKVIEPFINKVLKQYVSDNELNYCNRWKLLSHYVMYKKAIKQPITKDNINNLLPGTHEHVEGQIKMLNDKILFGNPKPLLNYLKSICINNGICIFDYKINVASVYACISKFGQHKIEDLKHAKNYKDVIEIITGSFAISTEGKCYYFCCDGIYEYHLTGRPNDYVAKYFPTKLIKTLTYEDYENCIDNMNSKELENLENEDDNNVYLLKLFKNKFDDLSDSKKKMQIKINAHTFITMLLRYFDKYSENGMTNFKLNGYDIKNVKPEVYEDVKNIIKLFENRLVEGCFVKNEEGKIIDNTLQEFLRSIKYLINNNEKPEKTFIVTDKYGATGKSLFFSKIIKDMFGHAGLNDDSLNCLESCFSDKYRYLYTVFNEVSKGKIDQDKITSALKELSDNNITSSSVKFVQNKKTFKNIGIYVLLSNSDDLNGALNYYDTALMSRFVLIEFQPFVKDDKVDSLGGSDYYKLIDKYKTYNDMYYMYSYDFRNALFKYIMELDTTKRTLGRAQPNQYKTYKYQELAKEDFNETINNTILTITSDKLFSVDLKTNTLSAYDENKPLVGFKLSDIKAKKDIKEKLLKVLDYKSAYNKRIRYNLDDNIKGNYKDNRFTLIICDNDKLKTVFEIKENIEINL